MSAPAAGVLFMAMLLLAFVPDGSALAVGTAKAAYMILALRAAQVAPHPRVAQIVRRIAAGMLTLNAIFLLIGL